ncbi:HigA family addiction module antitoxin [Fibrella aquatica]|uniref:HigA family addiction module antitoxin n=1 Tax=Fibrella aquatica TaxID=3242487 RepID=UPI003522FEBE
MALFDPACPGELIRETLEGIFEETSKKLTVAEVAAGIGTTRKTLSAILNGKQSVSPEMAIRLGTAFANTSPEFWLTVQENYDLAQSRQKVDTSMVTVFWKPPTLPPKLNPSQFTQ